VILPKVSGQLSRQAELHGRPGTGESPCAFRILAIVDRVESKGVKVVIVERADRLDRDLMVSEVTIDQLTRAGARVLTADGADLTSAEGSPTRTLIRQVLGAVAQFDKSVTVLKLRAARERIRRREGRCEGRKPFGSRPAEAAALARIRQLRRKPKGAPRLSVAAIAARLNSEAVPTRQGGLWGPSSVYAILRRTRNSG
jgi:DNA invertase Pin-like site-specific DNA recombinase